MLIISLAMCTNYLVISALTNPPTPPCACFASEIQPYQCPCVTPSAPCTPLLFFTYYKLKPSLIASASSSTLFFLFLLSDFGDFLAKSAPRKRLIIRDNNNVDKPVMDEFDSTTFVEESAAACKGKNKVQPPAAAADDGISTNDEEVTEIGLLVEDDALERSLVNCIPHGVMAFIGRRRAMYDAVAVVAAGDYAIFGVYDGHGGDGVSRACSMLLHELLLEKMNGKLMADGCILQGEWEMLMKESFLKMDEEVINGGIDGLGGGGGGCGGVMGALSSSVVMRTVGSTAVVVVVGKELLVVANCGDSRAVLCRGGIAVPLSYDHKPDRADEKERVEAAGGRVVDGNGSRILGVLPTSRAIGDRYLKPYVIAEPEVKISNRSASDEFLIIASDGLWDVVPNDFACDIAKKCLDGQVRNKFNEGGNSAAAAAMLAELALARGSKDNISVIVVELKRSSP